MTEREKRLNEILKVWSKKDLWEQIQNKNRIIAELRARLEKAVELPCKIGDIVYQTDTDGLRIFKSTVKNIIFETSRIAFDEQAIGESIFLTEEAVKEKMKKLQEKNNDGSRKTNP